MEFFRILNIFLNALACMLVLALLWAIYPYLNKLLSAVQTIHDFAK